MKLISNKSHLLVTTCLSSCEICHQEVLLRISFGETLGNYRIINAIKPYELNSSPSFYLRFGAFQQSKNNQSVMLTRQGKGINSTN